MPWAAVDLDDDPAVEPESVDLEPVDARVEPRRRQIRVANQGEQALLGLRAGEGGALGASQERAQGTQPAVARGARDDLGDLLAAQDA